MRERLSNEAEYIIITHDDFVEEANKLATHHRFYSGLKVSVLTLSEIYDDFSAGNADIMAIRNAIRYAYFNNSDDNMPKYVCLFETQAMTTKIGSRKQYDCVTYHSLNSFHLANSYMSDDFYAVMDINEGELGFYDRMDLAVGRILFDSAALAMVDNRLITVCPMDWQTNLRYCR